MNLKINRHLEGLEPYVPGEQPTESGWVKLNTNENPYPPAPEVLAALRSLEPESARKYPPPDCAPLRRAIAEDLDWEPEGILVTNGSDEALRMICHAYLNEGDRVGMLRPTYSLYPILARMFGGAVAEIPVGPGGEWPGHMDLDGVRVFFIANPNPPYGTFYKPDRVAELASMHDDILFAVDAAYIEFAPDDCVRLLREFKNVFIIRTFSKSHSLAGLRVGFILGHPEEMAPLWVVRDSYNVNAASQAAALAAWQAHDYYQTQNDHISEVREATVAKLAELGFKVLPSKANFVFARHKKAPQLFEQLKKKQILVRYFDSPETHDGLRITIGTPKEMEALFKALYGLLATGRK